MSICAVFRCRNRQTYIFHTHRWLWQRVIFQYMVSILLWTFCSTGVIQQVIISRVNRWRNEYDYMAPNASSNSNTFKNYICDEKIHLSTWNRLNHPLLCPLHYLLNSSHSFHSIELVFYDSFLLYSWLLFWYGTLLAAVLSAWCWDESM